MMKNAGDKLAADIKNLKVRRCMYSAAGFVVRYITRVKHSPCESGSGKRFAICCR